MPPATEGWKRREEGSEAHGPGQALAVQIVDAPGADRGGERKPAVASAVRPANLDRLASRTRREAGDGECEPGRDLVSRDRRDDDLRAGGVALLGGGQHGGHDAGAEM